ncbi:histamine H2 receptor-like [Oculina patagonica]
MANDTNSSFSNSSFEKIMARLPASDCIPWLIVLITESLAIVILNIITIIVFVKQRKLQRRSTYLIIHLAIVDLLVGGVSGPLQIQIYMAGYCGLWKDSRNLTWSFRVKFAFMHLFPFTSLINLVFVSMERLHATFCPFRHRFIMKRVYVVIIAAIWITTTVRESVQLVLLATGRSNPFITSTLYIPFYSMSVLIICFSYILIIIKVRCSRHPYHHGAASRERKLTGTSLIVALVSLLLWLPVITYSTVEAFHIELFSSRSLHFHLTSAGLTLFMANSIVNTFIYALRMPEFRAGVLQLFHRCRNGANSPNMPLRNLKPAKT